MHSKTNRSVRAVPSKLNSAAVIRKINLPLTVLHCDEGRGRRLNGVAPKILSLTLALNGRQTPGCIGIVCGRHKNVRHCDRGDRGPMTCTP